MKQIPITYYYKENYYAFMISVLKGWSPERSLRYMHVSSGEVKERKSTKPRYKTVAEACAVIHCATGKPYRAIGKMLNLDCGTVKHAIEYYRKEIKNECALSNRQTA